MPRFHPMPHEKVNGDFNHFMVHFMVEKYKTVLPNKKVRLSQGNTRLPVSQFQSQTKSLHNTEPEDHLRTFKATS